MHEHVLQNILSKYTQHVLYWKKNMNMAHASLVLWYFSKMYEIQNSI